MDKSAVLIGHTSSMPIIAMVFSSFNDGEEYMMNVMKRFEKRTGTAFLTHEDRKANKLSKVPLITAQHKKGKKRKITYEINDHKLSDGIHNNNWFFKHMFKGYYDGCGGVSYFTLEEVKCNAPIIEFSFD